MSYSKVLFLDIDGVVNCQFTKERFNSFIGIDSKLAERVKKIIKDTNCTVVLSSTWRLDEDSRNEVKNKVCDFIDITKNLASTSEPRSFRGSEINEWLSRHPEVKQYAILDDDGDFFSDQNLFQTNWQTGITEEKMQEVIDYFNK